MDLADLAVEAVARVGTTAPGGWSLRRLERLDLVAATYVAVDAAGSVATIQVLHAALATHPELVRTFAATSRATGAVAHPEAARWIGDGTLPTGEPYAILGPCEGETVAELVARRPGRIPPAEALRLIHEVLRLLDSAHRAGVVHGALLPDQIVVMESGAVRVLGFGTAALRAGAARVLGVDPSPTVLAFAPPEVTPHRSAAAAGDLWSVAALLFHLLTGEWVRRGASSTAPLAGSGLVAPAALEALLAEGLAEAPSSRFPTARAFADAVLRAMGAGEIGELRALRSSAPPDGVPPVSRAPGAPERSSRPPAARPVAPMPTHPGVAASASASAAPRDPQQHAGATAAAVTPEGFAADPEGIEDGDPASSWPEPSLPATLGAAWIARSVGEATGAHAVLHDLAEDGQTRAAGRRIVDVLPWGLSSPDGTTWEAHGLVLRGLRALHGAGLRRLALDPALDGTTLETLLDLPLAAESACDVSAMLAGLARQTPSLVELAPPRASIEPAMTALRAEQRAVVALARFDASAQLEECWHRARRRHPRAAPGTWRVAVATDLAPWLDEPAWIQDPRRRDAFCERLASESSAAEAWEDLVATAAANPAATPSHDGGRARTSSPRGVSVSAIESERANLGLRPTLPASPPTAQEDAAPLSEPIVDRYAACVVKLRRALADFPLGASSAFDAWRAIAEHLAQAPLDVGTLALTLAMVGTQRDGAARALRTAVVTAAAARAAGASSAVVSRLALAALVHEAARAKTAAVTSGDIAAAVATLAALAAPEDLRGRAACVIAAQAAALQRPRGEANRPSLSPPSRRFDPPASRPRSASAELVAAAAQLLEAMCPTGGDALVRSSTDALRWLALDGSRGHHAVGALVGALGGLAVGTVVELDDGAWAIVAAPAPQPGDVERPAVRIITSPTGAALGRPVACTLATATSAPRQVVRLVPASFCHFNLARAFAS